MTNALHITALEVDDEVPCDFIALLYRRVLRVAADSRVSGFDGHDNYALARRDLNAVLKATANITGLDEQEVRRAVNLTSPTNGAAVQQLLGLLLKDRWEDALRAASDDAWDDVYTGPRRLS